MYTVRSGDTLSHLAARFNTSVPQLARANNIQDPDLIHVGAQLRVPGAADGFDRGPAPGAQFQQSYGPNPPSSAVQPSSSAGSSSSESLAVARSLIGRAYGDPAGASAAPVGRDSPFMHCAQFVNAVYPDLPASAPQLTASATPGVEPKPGDVVTSNQPAPWGHVGIYTEKGTILHSIPGGGVHESSRAEFEQYSPITGVVQR